MLGNWVSINWSLCVSHLRNVEATGRLISNGYIILALFLDVLVDADPAIDEILLWKHGLEDLLTIVHVDTMQVLRLSFLFSDDIDTIEHAELVDMVEDLTFVVLFVLDWVKWEIELCEQFKLLDVLELEHFWDLVEGNIEEAECLYILETNKVSDSVLRNVELAEAGQVAEATDPRDWIVGKAELLEVQAVQILNLRDIVLPKWKGDEALITHNALNLVNLIAIEAQNF